MPTDYPSELPEVVIPDAAGVARRLAELQVAGAMLEEALRRAHLAGDWVTAAHARTYRGLKVYHEANGELRGGLAIRGWFFNDDDNIPRVIRPDGAVTITAVSGNEFVGMRGEDAQTRNPRGIASIEIVLQNGQLSLLDMLPEGDRERIGVTADVTTRTWFLLYYREGNVVRSELSLAHYVSEEGTVLYWAERLVLPEFRLYEEEVGAGAPPAPPAPDIDVPVTRRNG